MDVHARIAAGLHIAMAAFSLLVILFVGLVFGGIAALLGMGLHGDDGGSVLGLLAAFGTVLLGAFALASIAQMVAAILYLRGSEGARIALVVFSVLALLHIPIGTAIGAYSLWALLRPEAVPRAGLAGGMATPT